MKEIVSKRLREARIKANFTQVEAANIIQINNKTLSGYENKISEPDLETLTKLADIYKCTIDYLLGRDNGSNTLVNKAISNNVIKERLKEKRIEKNLTQKELAKLVHVSPQVISNWERGYTPEIGSEDLIRLATELNTTSDYLIGNEPLGKSISKDIINDLATCKKQNSNTFQERFNILFNKSQLSQEEFGRRVGATKFQVFNWRNARGEPDSEMMKAIAKVNNVSVSWLLGETDIHFPYNNNQIEPILKMLIEQRSLLEKVIQNLNGLSLSEQKTAKNELNKLISSDAE